MLNAKDGPVQLKKGQVKLKTRIEDVSMHHGKSTFFFDIKPDTTHTYADDVAPVQTKAVLVKSKMNNKRKAVTDDDRPTMKPMIMSPRVNNSIQTSIVECQQVAEKLLLRVSETKNLKDLKALAGAQASFINECLKYISRGASPATFRGTAPLRQESQWPRHRHCPILRESPTTRSRSLL